MSNVKSNSLLLILLLNLQQFCTYEFADTHCIGIRLFDHLNTNRCQTVDTVHLLIVFNSILYFCNIPQADIAVLARTPYNEILEIFNGFKLACNTYRKLRILIFNFSCWEIHICRTHCLNNLQNGHSIGLYFFGVHVHLDLALFSSCEGNLCDSSDLGYSRLYPVL